jgi:hypothetical protein
MQKIKKNLCFIPMGKLAVDEDELKRKRQLLKDKLQKGEKVVVEKSGNVNPNDDNKTGDNIQIKDGILAVDEDELKRKRQLLKDKLQKGEKVVVEKSGNVNPNDNSNSGDDIQIKPGKLAFYWYDENPDLYNAEIVAMNKYFPQFKFEKEDAGYWHGIVKPEILGGTKWYLQLAYDNGHPHNNNFGGSIKVYSIEPDLDELVNDFRDAFGKPLPHILTDPAGHKYMCTSERSDFNANITGVVTTAASCLTWAMKWISFYEILIAEDNTQKREEIYNVFAGHGNI